MTQRLQFFRDPVNFLSQRGPAVTLRRSSAGTINVTAGSRVRRNCGTGGRRGEHGHLLRTDKTRIMGLLILSALVYEYLSLLFFLCRKRVCIATRHAF